MIKRRTLFTAILSSFVLAPILRLFGQHQISGTNVTAPAFNECKAETIERMLMRYHEDEERQNGYYPYVNGRVLSIHRDMLRSYMEMPYSEWRTRYESRINELFHDPHWLEEFNKALKIVFLGEHDIGSYPEVSENQNWVVIVTDGKRHTGFNYVDCLNNAYSHAVNINSILKVGNNPYSSGFIDHLPHLAIMGWLTPKSAGGSGDEWPVMGKRLARRKRVGGALSMIYHA